MKKKEEGEEVIVVIKRGTDIDIEARILIQDPPLLIAIGKEEAAAVVLDTKKEGDTKIEAKDMGVTQGMVGMVEMVEALGMWGAVETKGTIETIGMVGVLKMFAIAAAGRRADATTIEIRKNNDHATTTIIDFLNLKLIMDDDDGY